MESLVNIHKFIDNFFKEGGVLSSKMPNFEYREGQVKMCHEVADTLIGGGILIAEAGTGIGKTMVYLIPAILSNEKVIISTGTKTLQEQIFFKDIPFLSKIGFKELSYCYMKGRNNYLCMRRYSEFLKDGLLPVYEEIDYLDEIKKWVNKTIRGDRSELAELPENLMLWREICCDVDNCHGRKCNYFYDCFLYKMRKEADDCQLIIVNHHLFFANLNLEVLEKNTLITECSRIIFDEAHMLEETALDYFSIKVAPWQLHFINKDIERKIYKLQSELSNKVKSLLLTKLKELIMCNNKFFNSFSLKIENKFKLDKHTFKEKQIDGANELIEIITDLSSLMKNIKVSDEEWQVLINRLINFQNALVFILNRESKFYVYWGEMQEKGSVILNATPIEASSILRDNLWQKIESAILTSATLSSQNGFDYIKLQLGIDECKERIYKSPFDYKMQSILYIPEDISEPLQDGFIYDIAEQVIKLIKISRGRAFILFTSFANMKQVYELLINKIDYPILIQGEKPKMKLIEEFKEKENTVLLATNSFWQGVDIVGSALSCVIIDKLPFSVPSDPVVEAKIENLRKKGRNPFYEFQLPEAILLLKQGLGRLIRSKSDIGIMALFDKRVYEKNYGKYILQSLEDLEITDNIKRVIEKMQNKLC